MTDSSNGLRFDIYERVQLSDDAPAIEALEEIELSPLIEAAEQEDSILLRGDLLLSGTYRAAGAEGGVGKLEHRIPVEISLPLSRVRQIEELDVEIDHFDVDLLTDRSLNVTGVLGLRGVQTEVREAPVWVEDGFTVAHEAPERVFSQEAADPIAALPPLGEAGYAEAADAGAAASGRFDQLAGDNSGAAAFGDQQQPPAYSQPGPVYLPPTQAAAGPGRASEAAASPVWYEQQRVRAEAEARAREEALLRQQELAQVAAEALERQLAESARAEAVRAAEAQAREAAERERAEQEAWRALEQAELLRQQAAERDRQEEAEAWERLLAYQRLEEEAASPAETSSQQPQQTQPQQSQPSDYPQVYDTAIPIPAAWPGSADSQGEAQQPAQTDPAYPQGAAPQAGPAAAEVQPAASAPDAYDRPEQTGPKLGLSGKGADGSGSDFGVGILSQLGDKGAIRQAGLQAAEEARLAAPAENKERASGDELEWTRLFLAQESGQSFRKVKLAIVQREDTLDAIAGRYQLQTRELQLYNRLSDSHLAEGQVLYIP